MAETLDSIVPSAAFLGALAVFAIFLTASRHWVADNAVSVRGAARTAALAVVAQSAHFLEELSTGFHVRFPELFGFPPMPVGFFVSFNAFWLSVWALSAWGLAHRNRAALFPLWFLGLGCIANGLAHPAFSVGVGGYFPGLATSPVVGLLGFFLLRRLLRVTHRARDVPGVV